MQQKKTNHFPLCPENKVSPEEKFSGYMNKTKSKTYTPCEKRIWDWTDKKKYLFHYRMLKVYVKHSMVFEKFHAVIPSEQSGCLKTYRQFNTEKNSS